MMFPKGFRPNKSLGQSFLISNKIADRLVAALTLTEIDEVLEIGAGLGILTTRLCAVAQKVYAVEIDQRLIPVLQENTKQFSNIEIINQDILKYNLCKFNNIKIIGNIPYNQSLKIFIKLLQNIQSWSIAVITAQREFIHKIISLPNKPGYCANTVLFEFFTERQKLFSIPVTAFKPAPKIVSTTILLKKRPCPLFPDIDSDVFAKIVNASFKQSRKTIANNLSLFLGIDKNILAQIADLDSTQRAENFSIKEFHQLTRHLSALL